MMQHGRDVRSEETVSFMMNSLNTESTWGVLGLININLSKFDPEGGTAIISAFCNQVILYSDKELNLNSIKNTFEEVLIEILFETNHLQERVTAAEFTAWQMIDTIMVIENCQPTLVHAPLSVVAYMSWGTGAARSSRDDS